MVKLAGQASSLMVFGKLDVGRKQVAVGSWQLAGGSGQLADGSWKLPVARLNFKV